MLRKAGQDFFQYVREIFTILKMAQGVNLQGFWAFGDNVFHVFSCALTYQNDCNNVFKVF